MILTAIIATLKRELADAEERKRQLDVGTRAWSHACGVIDGLAVAVRLLEGHQ